MSLTLKMSTRASCLNGTTTIVKFTGSSCLLTQHLNQKIIRQKLSWLLRPLFCTVALLRWDSIITYQWRCSLILNYILYCSKRWFGPLRFSILTHQSPILSSCKNPWIDFTENQLTSFYMKVTLVSNELILIVTHQNTCSKSKIKTVEQQLKLI